jgi:hypothetical protein
MYIFSVSVYRLHIFTKYDKLQTEELSLITIIRKTDHSEFPVKRFTCIAKNLQKVFGRIRMAVQKIVFTVH